MGEHGRTRPLNTLGGARQERQPLFSTLWHAAHKHSCPSHGPFVPLVSLSSCHGHCQLSVDSFIRLQVRRAQFYKIFHLDATQSWVGLGFSTHAGKHASACQLRIKANLLCRNLDCCTKKYLKELASNRSSEKKFKGEQKFLGKLFDFSQIWMRSNHLVKSKQALVKDPLWWRWSF